MPSTVRSFGTEDRPAPKHIPPRNEIYEFIIFRGSDIKDLHVSGMFGKQEDTPPDPAILSMSSVSCVLCSQTFEAFGILATDFFGAH